MAHTVDWNWKIGMATASWLSRTRSMIFAFSSLVVLRQVCVLPVSCHAIISFVITEYGWWYAGKAPFCIIASIVLILEPAFAVDWRYAMQSHRYHCVFNVYFCYHMFSYLLFLLWVFVSASFRRFCFHCSLVCFQHIIVFTLHSRESMFVLSSQIIGVK